VVAHPLPFSLGKRKLSGHARAFFLLPLFGGMWRAVDFFFFTRRGGVGTGNPSFGFFLVDLCYVGHI